MKVFKFGGASVKNADAVRNLGGIVLAEQEPLIIVVSAMDKTTNQLELVVNRILAKEDYQNLLSEIVEFHRETATELCGSIPSRCTTFLEELASACNRLNPETKWVQAYDAIVPFGELLSTSIIADFLSKNMSIQWHDARKLIVTDEFHTEANIHWDFTKTSVADQLSPILSSQSVITQGFIGATKSGYTTTLGREGSDFTGAILAKCLGAESFTVWKDVPGILNADPKLRSDAKQFASLSYKEVTEMTYYGAKVIHPKTLNPLAESSIPLIVRSFKDKRLTGTTISTNHSEEQLPVFVFKENQLLFTLEVRDHSFMNEKKLSVILSELDRLNVKINLMQNSALTFSFCMDNKEHKLEPIKSALSEHFEVFYNRPLKLTTVKNYDEKTLEALPKMDEVVLTQKTRSTYQVLWR